MSLPDLDNAPVTVSRRSTPTIHEDDLSKNVFANSDGTLPRKKELSRKLLARKQSLFHKIFGRKTSKGWATIFHIENLLILNRFVASQFYCQWKETRQKSKQCTVLFCLKNSD